MSELVSNTSPLIVLGKAGLTSVLPALFGEVRIPEAVRDEIMAGPEDDPMKRELLKCNWLTVVRLTPPVVPAFATRLGKGEAEAIQYAKSRSDCAVLLDDRQGRQEAQSFGLRLFGTLSIIAIATQIRLIPSFDLAVSRLRSAGLFVSQRVVDEVRREGI